MKRAHGFSNAAHDCVQNDVLKHSLGKFRKNVAWFNQGWTRTRGSINCQPTLDRADEFLHFCGPQHLLLSPNRFSKFGLELDSDNGATILFENNTFLQDVERRWSQRICLLCISRCQSSSQERSQSSSSSSFSPHSLELVKSDAPNGATRALAFHHMLCR